jgi:hypothetical protein
MNIHLDERGEQVTEFMAEVSYAVHWIQTDEAQMGHDNPLPLTCVRTRKQPPFIRAKQAKHNA